MAETTFLKLACMVIACMVVSAHLAEAGITCGQMTSALGPCVAYARGGGAGGVTPACCSGNRSLKAAAKTTPDRQAACKCLKSAGASISGLNYGIIAGLPGKCGVSMPYKISPSTNCDSVK